MENLDSDVVYKIDDMDEVLADNMEAFILIGMKLLIFLLF